VYFFVVVIACMLVARATYTSLIPSSFPDSISKSYCARQTISSRGRATGTSTGMGTDRGKKRDYRSPTSVGGGDDKLVHFSAGQTTSVDPAPSRRKSSRH
jgi:hypothetical protein